MKVVCTSFFIIYTNIHYIIVEDAAVNPNSIITYLASFPSKSLANGNPIYSNGPRSFPGCIVLKICFWTIWKSLTKIQTCLVVNPIFSCELFFATSIWISRDFFWISRFIYLQIFWKNLGVLAPPNLKLGTFCRKIFRNLYFNDL